MSMYDVFYAFLRKPRHGDIPEDELYEFLIRRGYSIHPVDDWVLPGHGAHIIALNEPLDSQDVADLRERGIDVYRRL